MRLIILFFILAFASRSYAGGCDSEAQLAKSKGIHRLVVSFEGLMSYNAGFVRRALIKDLSDSHKNLFHSKNYAYTSTTKAAACILEWKNVHRSDLHLTVVGHSFGGGIAVFKLLDLIPTVIVDVAMTLDPRSWTADSRFYKSKSLFQFESTDNVVRFINFYQRGSMPGYAVKGAENIELKHTRHTKVPAHPNVEKAARCLVFEDC